MQQLIQRIFDAFMPPGLKEAGPPEEVAKARTLIFLLLLTFTCAALATIGSIVIIRLSPSTLDSRAPFLLAGAAAGYGLGIAIFRRTGRNVVSTNILAVTYYAAIVIGAFNMSGQELFGSSLYLLALPFLVMLSADYRSAIMWVAMVAIAPVLWNVFGVADLGLYFVGSWIASSFGLFFAIYGSDTYLTQLSKRFNAQRTWLEFVAGHDPLTGVANRATFDRRLLDSIAFCKLNRTQSVMVIIDLDAFKPINDTYGHQAGDIVLTTVADRLRRLVRGSDTVARLGGDEFALLFDQSSPEGVKHVIDRIAAVIREPIDAFGKHLSVGCSLGVVVCPDDGLDPQQLAHKADARMYAAKRKAGSSRAATADSAAQRFLS